jgi:hypothetical protein
MTACAPAPSCPCPKKTLLLCCLSAPWHACQPLPCTACSRSVAGCNTPAAWLGTAQAHAACNHSCCLAGQALALAACSICTVYTCGSLILIWIKLHFYRLESTLIVRSQNGCRTDVESAETQNCARYRNTAPISATLLRNCRLILGLGARSTCSSAVTAVTAESAPPWWKASATHCAEPRGILPVSAFLQGCKQIVQFFSRNVEILRM